ncbi:MAG TPA: hypothetical protein VKU41_11470 [Polyangiaceae bacterium]|nr:hypothetical protein [Polyangiaceae bacterium]
MSVLCLCAMAGATAAGAAGCGANGNGGFASNASPGLPGGAADNNGASSGSANGGGNSTGPEVAGGSGSAAPTLPPEMKTESTFRSPVATGNVVWIANPTSGRVAYIDATTFAVQTVGAGNGPTYLAAVPDPTDDVAIVLNVLSQDATLLRDHQGTLSTTTLPSTPDANAWSVSSNGKWAVAWTDATQVPTAAPTQSFQDIAVMNLATATTSFLNVGYRPSQIAFSGDSAAYAVTQDGITVIDLTGAQPAVTKNLPLPAAAPPTTYDAGPEAGADAAEAGADAARQVAVDASMSDAAQAPSDAGEDAPQPVTTPAQATPDASAAGSTPDVSFTPDGAYALVRIDGLSSVTVIALATGTSTTIPLPSPPTDLTISPTGDFAMAVLRDQSAVVTLPLPGIVSNPASMTVTTVAGQVIGRAIVTKKGNTALLFTTVGQGLKGALTVLTLKPTPSYRTVTLYAPVLAVFPTDDEANAIVLHDVTPDPASGVVGAFSMVPLSLDLPAVLSSLPASPTAVAIAPTSDYALVSIRNDASGQFGIYMGLMPSLRVIPVPLASPPIAVGIVAGAARGYAAQDYSEGRVTFVNLAQSGCDGSTECVSARTITGFELGARVVNGNGSMP